MPSCPYLLPAGEGKGHRQTVKHGAAAEGTWREWMQDLGRQVRHIREFLGLTQQKLAQRAGVNQGAVSRFEGGRATPFLAIVCLNVALARALETLDASKLSEEARRYLRYMKFLAPPPEASEHEKPLSARPLTTDPEWEQLGAPLPAGTAISTYAPLDGGACRRRRAPRIGLGGS